MDVESQTRFMESMERIQKDDSEDAALDVFDQLVRHQIPKVMYRSFAHSGIQYRYATTMKISTAFRAIDYLAHFSEGPLDVVRGSLGYGCDLLCMWPLCVELTNRVGRWHLE